MLDGAYYIDSSLDVVLGRPAMAAPRWKGLESSSCSVYKAGHLSSTVEESVGLLSVCLSVLTYA